MCIAFDYLPASDASAQSLCINTLSSNVLEHPPTIQQYGMALLHRSDYSSWTILIMTILAWPEADWPQLSEYYDVTGQNGKFWRCAYWKWMIFCQEKVCTQLSTWFWVASIAALQRTWCRCCVWECEYIVAYSSRHICLWDLSSLALCHICQWYIYIESLFGRMLSW